MNFLSLLLSGISLGSVYALIALGYTMVYGIAKMLNFAHGDVIMVGGVIIVQVVALITNNMQNPALVAAAPFIALAVAIVCCTLLGMLIEKVAYKPLRQASSLAVLISAIGVSYLLQNVVLLTFGSQNKSISFPFMKQLSMYFGPEDGSGLIVQGETVLTIAVTVVIMIALTLFIRYTKAGKAMRAVSEDRGAAQLMGINVNGVISLTFAIGSALAAVAGFLYLGAYSQIGPYSGTMPGIKAFTAAVIGGIGSIPGAMLGGLLLGVIEQMSKAVLSQFQLAALADAVVFAVLIVVLLVKPTGIMGKKINEKV